MSAGGMSAPRPGGPVAAVPAAGEAVLSVRDLRVRFESHGRSTTALAGISLEVGAGEVLGVVGETGCGKTLTGLSVMRLLPRTARLEAAELKLLDRDLLRLPESELRALRGSAMTMVFQNPGASFNPVFTLGYQMLQVLKTHSGLTGSAARDRVAEVLTSVALPEAGRVMSAYPHQLSGGMLQRAMLGMALLSRPRLLIADEPTTALDVTIAAQVLELIRRLQCEQGFSVLFITHDLGVVRRMCDRVAVLYAGRVVEEAPVERLFTAPRHPYTRGLLAAVPRARRAKARLATIPGSVPSDPGALAGCAFRERCELAFDRCLTERPELVREEGGHGVACHATSAAACGREPRA